MSYISTESLKNTVNEMLISWNIPTEQAAIITDTVVYAHTHEKHTHGITRMGIYKTKMDNGWMPANTNVEIVSETPAITIMDCNNGFGQVAAYEGVKEATKKAEAMGIGAVFVRNSNNFGVAGYFGGCKKRNGRYCYNQFWSGNSPRRRK
jgi:L-2-hydroxycarboxylate dehydrogenase (NAD+)